MAKLLQLRRGNTEEHIGTGNYGGTTNPPLGAFTGEVGEVTVDTDKDVLVVHDNLTPGGHVMLGETQAKTFGSLYEEQNAHTSGAVAIDLTKGSNQLWELDAPITQLSITKGLVGQSGSIIFKLSNTFSGAAAVTGFSTDLKFTGGTQPSPSSSQNEVDRLDYIITEGSFTQGAPGTQNTNTHCVYNVGVA